MANTGKMKLTGKALEQLTKEPPSENVFDTELAGYHVRPGKRGLTFRLFYRTKTGKQRILTIGRYGTLTATQARKNATEALATVAQGGDPRAEIEAVKAENLRQQQLTLRAYLVGPYSAYQNRRKDGAGTLRRIEKDFADWLDKPMCDITRADVERWQAEQEKATKPRAFSTLKRSYDALRGLLAHAAEREVIPSNPLVRISLQRPALTDEEIAEQASQRRYLEPSEITALFAGLEAYQNEKRKKRTNSRAHGKAYLPNLDNVIYVDHVVPWVLTMYYTGLRPGDITGLYWVQINLKSKIIRKTIEKTAHHHPEPMNFPLSNAAASVLGTWHLQQGSPKSGLVFPNPQTGKRFDPTAMQKPWAKIRSFAELPDDLVLYTLRHNFASQLVMAGADLLTVSKLMAHSDIQTTIKYYAHLRPDHTRDIVELFAQQMNMQDNLLIANRHNEANKIA
ncbi:site-specific integrase [Halomonas sp. QX-2]|uniref:Site-specific integrase n=1 Tax=Vreelandella sedimenti TaxID=2729618 RepID=A0A7Z0SNB3_9GAMM|nr:site-specific integrase [Halomonas sedimenti]NYT72786.1 site-specific integrase [Halomonas sedimenti]